ncbi:MAG TPA: DUF1259 domain-containing protein [Acidobacteriaceae bacterium]|nr:DUF1259 domain-containing protein [Acidobacteriaceae bacterium]
MKDNKLIKSAILLILAFPVIAQQGPGTDEQWKPVETAMGRSGQMQPGGVFKFSMPRKDLTVTKDGVKIAPGLALGSWAAFKSMGGQTMVMGDLVLTENEVEPVMMSLQQNGIEQTALHNHLIGEQPRVMYMHIEGHGDGAALAKSLAAALALTKTPSAGPAAPAASSAPLGIDQAGVEKAMGYSGKVNGGILQFTVQRAEKIMENGMEIPPAMGTATGINFQPTSGGKAAISGDFVLLASEVNPVIRALRKNGIEVEAVHNHMLGDEPHMYFMHFWANDDAVKLATGLRAALDATNSQKPKM